MQKFNAGNSMDAASPGQLSSAREKRLNDVVPEFIERIR